MRESLGDFLHSNKEFWDKVTPLHIQSNYYRSKREQVLQRRPVIDKVALRQLGDIQGKAMMQPLCHLGYEALSLRMLGARSVVGWDFNECAMGYANEIAQEMELGQCSFRVSGLGDFRHKIRGPFDTVFISYGSLCWVPRLQELFDGLPPLLARGGELVIADFHPMLFCFDFLQATQIVHGYFDDEAKPIKISRFGSYAVPERQEETVSFNWNHAVSTIEAGLKQSGFEIISFEEYPFLPDHNGFPNLALGEDGFYRPSWTAPRIPLMFTLKAVHNGKPI
jgi:SAM-dependent methyltransferase